MACTGTRVTGCRFCSSPWTQTLPCLWPVNPTFIFEANCFLLSRGQYYTFLSSRADYCEASSVRPWGCLCPERLSAEISKGSVLVTNDQWVSKCCRSPQTRTTLQTHNTVHSATGRHKHLSPRHYEHCPCDATSCADSECSWGRRIQLAEAAGIQTRTLIRMVPGYQEKQRLQRAVGQRRRWGP